MAKTGIGENGDGFMYIILYKGGDIMKGILKALAVVIAHNAKEGAGAASYHGLYEAKIPDSLKKA